MLRETVKRRSGLSTAGLGVVAGLVLCVTLCPEDGEGLADGAEDRDDLLPVP